MTQVKPTVSWQELQRRKLQVMTESVRHFKDVGGMKIVIHPDVYPPGTDTHLMIDTVKIKAGGKTLDIGTGTGAIACRLALLGAGSVLGVDRNPRAVINANENKKLLNLKNASFRLGNVFDGVDGKFDVIAANLPYTNKQASDDIDICFYDKGHKALRTFFAELHRHLTPNGIAYLAWSNISSLTLLPELAEQHNLRLQLVNQDVGGRGYTFYVYTLKPKRLQKLQNE